MSEIEMREDLILPQSGELISLSDPDKVASALTEIRELEARFREVKAILTDALVVESQRQGSKTLHLDGMKAEIRGGEKVVWDATALMDGLQQAGMDDEHIAEVVRTEISYSVVAGRATRAAKANPAYAAVIDSCKTVIETNPTAVISKT